MKKITYLFSVSMLLLGTALHAQDEPAKESPFTLKGKVPASLEGDTLVLSYYTPKGKKWEQMPVKNGMVEMHSSLNRIQKAYLYDSRRHLETREVYLEPGKDITLAVNGNDWQSVVPTGGPIQADWLLYEKQKTSLAAKQSAMRARYGDFGTKGPKEEYEKLSKSLLEETRLEQLKFIKTHPDSYVSLDMVMQRTFIVDKPEDAESFYNLLGKKWKESKAGQGIASRIEAARKNAVGKIATDFTSVDTLGNEFKLASLRGQYVLVDFWASWCGFCRAQTPTLKEVYAKYKNKNFTIISVSYDETKDKWMKAIHEDDMPWQQISELKGMGTAPSAKDYGITAIPQNVLLDPNGKIVAKNINVTQFDKKIGEIIGASN